MYPAASRKAPVARRIVHAGAADLGVHIIGASGVIRGERSIAHHRSAGRRDEGNDGNDGDRDRSHDHDSPAVGWRVAGGGSATMVGDTLQLTDARTKRYAGSAFWPHRLSGAGTLTATFDEVIEGGSGADGLTLTILDAAAGRPSALGSIGGGLGWSGIRGFAVAFDTFQDPGDPSYPSGW